MFQRRRDQAVSAYAAPPG